MHCMYVRKVRPDLKYLAEAGSVCVTRMMETDCTKQSPTGDENKDVSHPFFVTPSIRKRGQ